MKGTNSLRRIGFKAHLYLKRNSSTILACLASAGVVATAVSAARATPKAMSLLEKTRMEQQRRLTNAEKMVVAAPVYVPTILLGAATVSCVLGANVLSRKQQASIASAYALVSRSYKDYRQKLIETCGKETDNAIRDAVVREHCDYHAVDCDIPEGKLVFYEELSGEYFVRYERDVMDAEYHLNRNFVLRGCASLNEFFVFLGLPKTDYGDELGWSDSYGYYWIDFEHRLISKEGEEPVYMIDYGFTAPDADYLREWGMSPQDLQTLL